MATLPPREVLLEMLPRGPLQISESTADLPPAALRAAPPDGGWSVNEVLAHLRSCADVWGGCIATILAEERPTIRAVSPPSWLTQTNYLELEFEPSFRSFADQRRALIATLRRLSPEEWLRPATVVGAGRPVERSVHTYTEWIAVHERAHLKQIRRIAQALGG